MVWEWFCFEAKTMMPFNLANSKHNAVVRCHGFRESCMFPFGAVDIICDWGLDFWFENLSFCTHTRFIFVFLV